MTKPPRKLSRVFLVLSLAANVLLVGLIVGAAASGRGAPTRGFEPGLGPMGQVLPKEDRAKIGREIRRGLRDLGRAAPARREAMEAVIAALEAEAFDPEAFEAIIRAQQGWQDQVREVALSAFVDHISGMSLDDRQNVATALRTRIEKGARGPGNDRSPDQN